MALASTPRRAAVAMVRRSRRVRLVSTGEAAKALGISRRTLAEYARTGQLTPARHAGQEPSGLDGYTPIRPTKLGHVAAFTTARGAVRTLPRDGAQMTIDKAHACRGPSAGGTCFCPGDPAW